MQNICTTEVNYWPQYWFEGLAITSMGKSYTASSWWAQTHHEGRYSGLKLPPHYWPVPWIFLLLIPVFVFFFIALSNHSISPSFSNIHCLWYSLSFFFRSPGVLSPTPLSTPLELYFLQLLSAGGQMLLFSLSDLLHHIIFIFKAAFLGKCACSYCT